LIFCNTCQFWGIWEKEKNQIERTISSGYQKVQRTTKFHERTGKDPTGFKAVIWLFEKVEIHGYI
jgi:hypothetical protein